MADTTQRRRFLHCPRCGAENLPLNKFCGNCGASLRGDAPAGPAMPATTLPPKSGALLPYSPGLRGPGTGARLMVGAALVILCACLILFYVFLVSGADRTPPRPTQTPAGYALAPGL